LATKFISNTVKSVQLQFQNQLEMNSRQLFDTLHCKIQLFYATDSGLQAHFNFIRSIKFMCSKVTWWAL